ncbi:MAG: stage III sporulation protein AD [Anaeromicrobium sp.]|jgi:stage III sporulation protein AD|uniref:stage III sporulation protein AD n=1 Tax=Anaeromicrobium sp. TaxID=1929132 RepID=UPI0025D87C0E|nr:stage III sporulation protein AD [Anaeromicrobium sp.]MCT4596168.1 stage III sporulation protein AD [Anaeromicrobium sp.]
MDIFKIVGVGIIATVLSMTFKKHKPEISLQISLVAGLVIFLFILSKLGTVLELLNMISKRLDIDIIYISTIFKIIGIAYIAEFGAQLCKDAGEGAIASKIELAGKVLIMVLAIPILVGLLNTIIQLIA